MLDTAYENYFKYEWIYEYNQQQIATFIDISVWIGIHFNVVLWNTFIMHCLFPICFKSAL